MTAQSTPFYYRSLTLANVRSFAEPQTLDLTGPEGGPAAWTLLLGDNGVGKTTLLECLANMRPELTTKSKSGKTRTDAPAPRGAEAWLSTVEDNDALTALCRWGEVKVQLKAQFAIGERLDGAASKDANKSLSLSATLSFEEGRLVGAKTPIQQLSHAVEPVMIAYGAARHPRRVAAPAESINGDPVCSLFDPEAELIDVRKVLQDLDYAEKSGDHDAGRFLTELKAALCRLLPDIRQPSDIRIYPPAPPSAKDKKSGVHVETPYGEAPLDKLSLGYQTMAAWTVDLAWRLYDHYPKSPLPLAEPAIVLVDEIDLHLHPNWQRGLRAHISDIFPAVQFIVTGHSPILAQTFLGMNIAIVREEAGRAVIRSDPKVVETWRIDQLVESVLFDFGSIYPPQIEEQRRERRDLLRRRGHGETLTPSEERRLETLNAFETNLDPALSAQDKEALEVIRKTAALVKSAS